MARRVRDQDGHLPQHPRVVIRGARKGYRSCAVIAWPDGSITRGDADLSICTGIPTLTAAGRVVGMTRDEFIAARDAARAATMATSPTPALVVGSFATLSTPARGGERSGRVRITWVEDRGAFWYFGWSAMNPIKDGLGTFGASRLYKDGSPWGVSLSDRSAR